MYDDAKAEKIVRRMMDADPELHPKLKAAVGSVYEQIDKRGAARAAALKGEIALEKDAVRLTFIQAIAVGLSADVPSARARKRVGLGERA